jgi:mRNA-degrading endonuclease HigB of HigAB toxin-antitoxin module
MAETHTKPACPGRSCPHWTSDGTGCKGFLGDCPRLQEATADWRNFVERDIRTRAEGIKTLVALIAAQFPEDREIILDVGENMARTIYHSVMKLTEWPETRATRIRETAEALRAILAPGYVLPPYVLPPKENPTP